MTGTPTPLTRLGGQGPAVLLLHGYGSDRQSWLATAPALFDSATVWVLDLPAHGVNSARALSSMTIASLTRHVASCIEITGLQELHLIGHSLGARLALELAYQDLIDVLSLVLITPAGVSRCIHQRFLTNYADARQQDAINLLLNMLVHDPRLISASLASGVLSYLQTPGVRQSLHAIAHDLIHSQPQMQTVIATIGQSTVPRLCIWGDKDQVNPLDPDNIALLNAQIQLLENCGHLPHIEKRSAVNRRILAFYQELVTI